MFVRAEDAQLADLYNAYRACALGSVYAQGLSIARFISYLGRQDIDLGQSWICVDHGRVIGIALVGVRGDNRNICNLAVSADHRGKGIGTALLEHCLSQSLATSQTLLVSSSNQQAIRLYNRVGFSTIASHGFWYRQLPMRLKPHQLVRPIDVDIAMEMSSHNRHPWPLQDKSLIPMSLQLQGVVGLSAGVIKSVAIVYPGDIAAVYRVIATSSVGVESILRHVMVSVPCASGISLRWIRDDQPLTSLISALGFRKYGEYQEMQWLL